jgi:hypothetical protein
MKHTTNILGILASQAARLLEQWTDLNPGKDALEISRAATGIEDSLNALQRELDSITQSPAPSPSLSRDSESIERTMAILATQAWRMGNRLIDSDTKEARETLESRDCRNVGRAWETIMDELLTFGVTIKDRTGENYDEGLPEKVVNGEPRAGLTHPRIIETLKPTIYLEQKIIQLGDIIVGLPTQTNSHEPTNH